MRSIISERRLTLVAGIPATGKSTYCGWLRAAKGFTHLDIDRDVMLMNQQIVAAGSMTEFVQRLPDPTVIDWGFPAGSAPVVHLMKAAGVQLWWFDGDPSAARAAYIKRGRGSIDDFDRQMEGISESKSMIESLFGENRITVLDASGRYLPEVDICRRMFDDTEETI